MNVRALSENPSVAGRNPPGSGAALLSGLGASWRQFRPGLKTAAKVGAFVAFAPVTLPWLAYGAWLTARRIDRCGDYE